MIDTTDIDRLLDGNATVYDRDGDKIGSLGQIYLDDTTGEPTWATVNTGLFGISESFVPLQGAVAKGEDLHVEYTKDKVKDAPNIDEERHLEPEDEDRLYEYYGIETTGHAGVADQPVADQPITDRPATDRPVADQQGDDASMVRSEERLRVGTESHETGRVRLRKYTVTENVTKTIPVEREEVRVERVPVDEDATTGRIDDEDETAEVTLHEERPVVDKDTVAVEEVRLGKETVTGEETVSAEVRKEQIDTDDTLGDR